ncbi:MAG: hypothetical protein KatS3mg096_727 [Candidatus Parcubacteria bacterium]|nr:MAG: hypothetical protein KatS3mg096_727 [Candidatus Parcubacteria bacterium]
MSEWIRRSELIKLFQKELEWSRPVIDMILYKKKPFKTKKIGLKQRLYSKDDVLKFIEKFKNE